MPKKNSSKKSLPTGFTPIKMPVAPGAPKAPKPIPIKDAGTLIRQLTPTGKSPY